MIFVKHRIGYRLSAVLTGLLTCLCGSFFLLTDNANDIIVFMNEYSFS